MIIEHYVKFLYPGSFVSEEVSERVDYRPAPKTVEVPTGAYAFQLYDVEIREGVLEDGDKIENRKKVNESGVYYPEATILNLQDAIRKFGARSILVGNMECNGWNAVIETRRGNVQPLREGDEVLPYDETKRVEAER